MKEIYIIIQTIPRIIKFNHWLEVVVDSVFDDCISSIWLGSLRTIQKEQHDKQKLFIKNKKNTMMCAKSEMYDVFVRVLKYC